MMPPKTGNYQTVEFDKPVRTKANQKTKQEGGDGGVVVMVRSGKVKLEKISRVCAGGFVDRSSSWW